MLIRSIPSSSLIVGVLVFGGLLGGCATNYPQRESQRQAAYQAATGAPVRSFRFFGSLYSWEPLGNQQLAVYTRPNQAWLLDVPGCNELPFATAIGHHWTCFLPPLCPALPSGAHFDGSKPPTS